MAGILIDDLDRIVCANGLISQVWAGPALVYQYDNIKPVLDITSPEGKSASSPSYVQSDEDAMYTVAGTVYDAESGVKSVTVNGVPAVINGDVWSITLTGLSSGTTHTITVQAEDNAGNSNTAVRYLRVEAYHQQAARTAGITPAASITELLANSSSCTAIASNVEARNILKNHYRAAMTNAVDTAWNDGLNTLMYACKLKCYLYKDGNQCASITGGWTAKWDVELAGASMNAYVNYDGAILMSFKRTNGDGLYRDTCNAATSKSIDVTGFDKINWNVIQISSKGKKQFMYGDSYYHEGVTTVKTHVFDAKSGIQRFRWTDVPHSNVGEQTCAISSIWLDPVQDENAVVLTLRRGVTDADAFAVIDGDAFAVVNVTVDGVSPTATTYNFDII